MAGSQMKALALLGLAKEQAKEKTGWDGQTVLSAGEPAVNLQ